MSGNSERLRGEYEVFEVVKVKKSFRERLSGFVTGMSFSFLVLGIIPTIVFSVCLLLSLMTIFPSSCILLMLYPIVYWTIFLTVTGDN